jgi:drug/metabolite transporter (DMT)-like permease
MNLPLHVGLLGTLEAGLIALLVGLLVYALWHRLCRWAGWTDGHAIGWACVIAVVASAGIDAWNLFYMGMMRLEGSRVVLEVAGAIGGVALGWLLFSSRSGEKNSNTA